MQFNERLRILRERGELTQNQVAQMINCAKYTYQRYEYGTQLIPIDKLMILADFYNTSADYILGRTNEKKPYPKA